MRAPCFVSICLVLVGCIADTEGLEGGEEPEATPSSTSSAPLRCEDRHPILGGGTCGGSIEGALFLFVQSAHRYEPVAGARVEVVGQGGATFSGRTDERGAFEIEDPRLQGPVTVHVFPSGHAFLSLINVNAARITTEPLPLRPRPGERVGPDNDRFSFELRVHPGCEEDLASCLAWIAPRTGDPVALATDQPCTGILSVPQSPFFHFEGRSTEWSRTGPSVCSGAEVADTLLARGIFEAKGEVLDSAPLSRREGALVVDLASRKSRTVRAWEPVTLQGAPAEGQTSTIQPNEPVRGTVFLELPGDLLVPLRTTKRYAGGAAFEVEAPTLEGDFADASFAALTSNCYRRPCAEVLIRGLKSRQLEMTGTVDPIALKFEVDQGRLATREIRLGPSPREGFTRLLVYQRSELVYQDASFEVVGIGWVVNLFSLDGLPLAGKDGYTGLDYARLSLPAVSAAEDDPIPQATKLVIQAHHLPNVDLGDTSFARLGLAPRSSATGEWPITQ